MSTIHRTDGGFVQYTKGAPDEVLRRCTHYTEGGAVLPMTEEKRAAILADNKAMADKALRVLAAAQRLYDSLPDRLEPEDLEQDLCFIGLAGMIDPVRPEVKDAVAQCRAAGIRPVMITGDHKDTAVAIAKELGIITDASQAVTGSALDGLSDEELDNVSGGGCGPTYYEACMANGYCSDYICSRCGSRGIIVRNGELRCSGCLAYNPRCWNCMNSIGDKRSKILTCKVRLRRGTPE